jgi:hypothetical protein
MSANGNSSSELEEIRRERDELREKVKNIESAVVTIANTASEYMEATRAIRARLNGSGLEPGEDLGTLADRADAAERALEQYLILARQHGLFGER